MTITYLCYDSCIADMGLVREVDGLRGEGRIWDKGERSRGGGEGGAICKGKTENEANIGAVEWVYVPLVVEA